MMELSSDRRAAVASNPTPSFWCFEACSKGRLSTIDVVGGSPFFPP